MGYYLSRERLLQFQEPAERTGAGPELFRLRSSAVAKRNQPNPAVANCAGALMPGIIGAVGLNSDRRAACPT